MSDSSYVMSCIQCEIFVIQDPADKDKLLKKNLDRSLELAAYAAATEESRLFVFPEGWLQGFVPNRTVADWLEVCIKIPGPETDKLGDFCRQHGTYIAGAAFEKSDAWPDRFFNSAFIVGPAGKVELKYRQLNPETLNGLLPVTSPADVLNDYARREGESPLFPVLDTPFGRLARPWFDGHWKVMDPVAQSGHLRQHSVAHASGDVQDEVGARPQPLLEELGDDRVQACGDAGWPEPQLAGVARR